MFKPVIYITLSLALLGCSSESKETAEKLNQTINIDSTLPTPVQSVTSQTPSPIKMTANNEAKKSQTISSEIKTNNKKKVKTNLDTPVPTEKVDAQIEKKNNPTQVKKSPKPVTVETLPTDYILYEKYKWEEDPTRYGIPYTDKKPTQYVKTGAIFMLPENKLLLVRADLVVSRTADLYRDVLSAEIVEEEKVYLVIATCLDGSKTAVANIQKIAWLPGQHPSTFWFSAILDNGRACDN